MMAGFFCISVRFFGGVISHISTRWEGSWMVDVSSIMAASKLSGDPPQASVVQVLLYSLKYSGLKMKLLSVNIVGFRS